MSGLERITGQIVEEAKETEARILAEARAKAQEIAAQAEASCREISEQGAARCAAEKKDLLHRGASAARQKHRQTLLAVRQSLIDETLDKAQETLLHQPDRKYFQTLSQMAEAHARGREGTLWLNEADLSRMPGSFPEAAARAGQKAGGTLAVSKTPCDIAGGFLLKYGAVEENCSFEALFAAERERLRDQLNTFLFE